MELKEAHLDEPATTRSQNPLHGVESSMTSGPVRLVEVIAKNPLHGVESVSPATSSINLKVP